MSFNVKIKQPKNLVSGVNIGPKPEIYLDQILDVNASSKANGHTLVYDGSTNKYVVKSISVDSNNVVRLSGGTF